MTLCTSYFGTWKVHDETFILSEMVQDTFDGQQQITQARAITAAVGFHQSYPKMEIPNEITLRTG